MLPAALSIPSSERSTASGANGSGIGSVPADSIIGCTGSSDIEFWIGAGFRFTGGGSSKLPITGSRTGCGLSTRTGRSDIDAVESF